VSGYENVKKKEEEGNGRFCGKAKYENKNEEKED